MRWALGLYLGLHVGSDQACHLAALLGAPAACVRTPLAVRFWEPRTFRRAGVADVGAQAADLVHKLATSGHPLDRHRADVSTVPEDLDAATAGARIWGLQAGGGTVFALQSALLARRDTGAVLFVHRIHPFSLVVCAMFVVPIQPSRGMWRVWPAAVGPGGDGGKSHPVPLADHIGGRLPGAAAIPAYNEPHRVGEVETLAGMAAAEKDPRFRPGRR